MSRNEQRRSRYRDAVRANTRHQKESRKSFGYLNLPSGVRMIQPKPNTRMQLDFMPYVVSDEHHPDRKDDWKVAVPGEAWYRRPFKVHRNIGAEQESVVCLASVGRKCPICEYRTDKMKSGADKNETDALKYSQRNLYCVTPLGDKEHEETPHIWDVSQFLFQDLLNNEMEEDERYYDFFDPEVGLTLKVRFDEVSRIDFIDRDYTYAEKELKKVPDLDKVLNIMSYKELDKLFLGLEEDDVEGGSGKPARSQPKDEDKDPQTRRGSRARPDNDDGDDDKGSRDKDKDKDDDKSARSERSAPRRTRDDDGEDKEEKRGREPRREDKEEQAPRRTRSSAKDEDEGGGDPQPRQTRTRAVADDEDKEKPSRSARNNSNKAEGDEKCPSGHKFGRDVDEYDECGDCPMWEACIDAKEERARAK